MPSSNFILHSGDLEVWWREQLSDSKGHIGIVHQLRNGFLYTIEGNKNPDVQGFSYIFSRMEKLLGFGRTPN